MGGHEIVKQSKKRKVQTKDEEREKAINRVYTKLGKDEALKVIEEYKKASNEQGEGIILILIASGLSGIEINLCYMLGANHRTLNR